MNDFQSNQYDEKVVEQRNATHTPIFAALAALLFATMLMFCLSSCAPYNNDDPNVADETADIDGVPDDANDITAGEFADEEELSDEADADGTEVSLDEGQEG